MKRYEAKNKPDKNINIPNNHRDYVNEKDEPL